MIACSLYKNNSSVKIIAVTFVRIFNGVGRDLHDRTSNLLEEFVRTYWLIVNVLRYLDDHMPNF